jgi:Uma2 family endonuclease
MSKSLLDAPDPIPDGPDHTDQVIAQLEAVELVYSDGEPMESNWHVRCMNLLIDQIEYHFRDRRDFFVGGNMFIYYSLEQARNRDFRGPDFFYVRNAKWDPDRLYWAVWLEDGQTPNVVIELASPSTKDEDRGPKFRIYRDRLHIQDYFIFDRDTGLLEGWRLEEGPRYRPLQPDANSRLWSAELELFVGPWEGEVSRFPTTWVRFFDRDGRVVPIAAEAAKQRADDEKQRADDEKQRADDEKRRAEALAAENVRLKEQLARLQAGEKST